MLCVDPGNIADRGHEEFYTSPPYQVPDGLRPTRISWDTTTPPRTWVRAQLRSAPNNADLQKAAWQGPDGGEKSWFEQGESLDSVQMQGEWIQYRLALGAYNSVSTPRIEAVHVDCE